jgi:hypothetical protein
MGDAAMIRNRQLVSKAKVFARERNVDEKDRIAAMIEQYEVACDLSLGPDASRSKAWESKAAERRNVLANTIGFQE